MEKFAKVCNCGEHLVYAYFKSKEWTIGYFLCPKCDKEKLKESVSIDTNTNFSEIQD